MAQTGYIFIKGEDQGEIESDLDAVGREGGIPFYAFYHSIRVPEVRGFLLQDENRPTHNAMRFVKQIDETSTSILQALCLREKLTDVEIHWFTFRNGVEEEDFSVTLTGCRFVSVAVEGGVSAEAHSDVRQVFSETFEIVYQTIRWDMGALAGDEAVEDAGEDGASSDGIFDFDAAAASTNRGMLYH